LNSFPIKSIQIPAWTNWIAQDANGCWWAYEVEPLQYHQGWYENEVGRVQKIEVDYNKKDWQNSLIRLNHDQEMA